MIVNNPHTADSLFTALHKARGGTHYPEPYARLLRISEYIITQVNTDVIPWSVYFTMYETLTSAWSRLVLSNAWSRLDDEMCIQEGFDL